MVLFKDSSATFQKPSVTIVKDKHETLDKGTTLTVFPPIIGSLAPNWHPFDDVLHMPCWSVETIRDVHDTTSAKTASSTVFLLQSSLHSTQSQPSKVPLLGRRITNGEVAWRSPLKFSGEFSFTPGYWEWMEDILARNETILITARIYNAVSASLFTYECKANVIQSFCEHWNSSTNTLYTSNGEKSISLWEMRFLFGLPICGLFYDEVVPSAEELTMIDEYGQPMLPRSCKYLFLAFHMHCRKVGDLYNMSIYDWVQFWFRGPLKYRQSPNRSTVTRTSQLKSPSGFIKKPSPYSQKEEGVFNELGITDNVVKNEVHLAALLACWLCKFALPNKNTNLIRPSVFKVASMMAIGRCFSLAVPVLTSIYSGLREISTSSDLSKCDAAFPIHYVYSWLAEHFDTHSSHTQNIPSARMAKHGGDNMAKNMKDSEANNLFKKASQTILPVSLVQDKLLFLTDNGDLIPFF